MDDRLYKSTTDRSVAGVCGGLAAWLGLDPSLVRIGWVLLSLLSGGAFVILYIVMAVVVPDAPPGWAPRGRGVPPSPSASWGPGYGQPGYGQPAWGSAPGGAWTGSTGWQGGTTPDAPSAGLQGGPGPNPAPTSWPEDWRERRPDGGSTLRADQAGIALGGILIALGAWFLVRNYIAIDWDLVWPVAVMVLGGLLIAGAMRRGR